MEAHTHTSPVTKDGELAKKLALMFVDLFRHHCVATASDVEVGKNLSL